MKIAGSDYPYFFCIFQANQFLLTINFTSEKKITIAPGQKK